MTGKRKRYQRRRAKNDEKKKTSQLKRLHKKSTYKFMMSQAKDLFPDKKNQNYLFNKKSKFHKKCIKKKKRVLKENNFNSYHTKKQESR